MKKLYIIYINLKKEDNIDDDLRIINLYCLRVLLYIRYRFLKLKRILMMIGITYTE